MSDLKVLGHNAEGVEEILWAKVSILLDGSEFTTLNLHISLDWK